MEHGAAPAAGPLHAKLRRPLPDGPVPSYALYLLGSPPPEVPWEADWLRWPDFRLPRPGRRAILGR